MDIHFHLNVVVIVLGFVTGRKPLLGDSQARNTSTYGCTPVLTLAADIPAHETIVETYP